MIEVHVNFGNLDDARRISRAVLERRLAACVNIFNGVQSLYWWDGRIEDETETLAIFKTADSKADALEAFIAEHHPYETPAIIRLTGVRANDDYARWVDGETA